MVMMNRGDLGSTRQPLHDGEAAEPVRSTRTGMALRADKALIGDSRVLSSLGNNVVAPSSERSRAAIGTTPVDTVVTAVEEGSGVDPCVRITEINNDRGPGNISQGVNGQPIAGCLQLEGPDGVCSPMSGCSATR